MLPSRRLFGPCRRYVHHTLAKRFSAAVRHSSESLIPTRHSRNLPPPVCRDAAELFDLTCELIEIQLVPYTLAHERDLWQSNEIIIGKAEYTIRGHAACIPNTLVGNNQHSDDDDDDDDDPKYHVESMQAILYHFQEQNKAYMTLRRQLQSQVSTYEGDSSDSSSSSSSSSDEEEDKEESSDSRPSTTEVAGPGPTVEMWDTLLDSLAVSSTATSPLELKEILEQVLTRHHQDGGPEYNVNPYTVPTILTFNAVLRTVANFPITPDTRKLRDEALKVAFGVYDEMRWHVDRNSATFQYMLEIIQKCLPPSRSRGNISFGLWTQAQRHHVASSQVLQALHQAHVPSNGEEEFDEWLAKHDDIRKIPLKWRREHKMKRYDETSGIY